MHQGGRAEDEALRGALRGDEVGQAGDDALGEVVGAAQGRLGWRDALLHVGEDAGDGLDFRLGCQGRYRNRTLRYRTEFGVYADLSKLVAQCVLSAIHMRTSEGGVVLASRARSRRLRLI